MRTLLRAALCGTLAYASASLPPFARIARADDAAARKHFLAGRDAYDKGDFARAVTEFEAALAESGRAELYFNIARAYDKLGKVSKAVGAYRRYLQLKPDADDRAEVDEIIRRHNDQLGHIDLRVDGAGIEVRVDGQPQGVGPLVAVIDVDEGAHTIAFTRPGALPRTTQILVASGKTVRLGDADSQLVPTPEPAREGARDATGPATDAGTLSAHASGRHSKLRLPAYILLGGVAVVGGGVGLGVAALHDKSLVEQAGSTSMPMPASAVAGEDASGRTYASAGIALDVVGGALLAADVALWLLAARDESRAARGVR